MRISSVREIQPPLPCGGNNQISETRAKRCTNQGGDLVWVTFSPEGERIRSWCVDPKPQKIYKDLQEIISKSTDPRELMSAMQVIASMEKATQTSIKEIMEEENARVLLQLFGEALRENTKKVCATSSARSTQRLHKSS